MLSILETIHPKDYYEAVYNNNDTDMVVTFSDTQLNRHMAKQDMMLELVPQLEDFPMAYHCHVVINHDEGTGICLKGMSFKRLGMKMGQPSYVLMTLLDIEKKQQLGQVFSQEGKILTAQDIKDRLQPLENIFDSGIKNLAAHNDDNASKAFYHSLETLKK